MRKIFMLVLFACFSHLHVSSQAKNKTNYLTAPEEILSQYLKVESFTGAEKKAGLYFSSVCEELGLQVKVFTAEEDSYNFSASIYPLELGKPNIIFLNHIDVVPASDTSANWQYPPFSGTISDSIIWGRGALDNKGVAVMQLFAVADFIAAAKVRDLPYNVTILSVSAEETGGKLGAKIISEKYLALLNPRVVIGEGGAGVTGILPSDAHKKIFGIEINHKSSLSLRLNLKVKSSGHGAVPPKRYTNKVMVASLNNLMERKPKIIFTAPTRIMLKELGNLEGGIRGFILRHAVLFKPLLTGYIRKDPILQALFTNTVTVTHLENPPKSPNQISQEITAILDCRLLPGTDEKKFVRSLVRVFDSRNMTVEVIAKSMAAPSSSTKDKFFPQLEAAVKIVYPEAETIPILFPASNDNNYFRRKGVPVFGLTPIFLDKDLLSSIHNFNERMPIRALHNGIAVFSHFLKRIYLVEE